MNILMTGDRGYIGTVAKKYLRKRGHSVVGLDTNYFDRCVVSGFVEAPEFHIDKDIRDVEVGDLRGYDAIVHLAGLSNDLMGDLDDDLTYSINLLATIELASMAKEAGVGRFIFVSSCSVYGSNDEEVNEKSEPNPQTAYARYKLLAERGIMALEEGTFSPVILRLATVFGYSPRLRNDLVVNTMTACAFVDGKINVNGTGELWRPLISVSDVARVINFMLQASYGVVHNQIFNVGFSSENYIVAEVAAIVSRIVGADITYTPSQDTRNYRASFSKLTKAFLSLDIPSQTVYEAVIELQETLMYLESSMERNLTKEELLGDKYVRLLRLTKLMKEGKLDDQLRWVNHYDE
jgi:nucleoside-diphosphate-sugar epimerase